MSNSINSWELIHTEQGKEWLNQFKSIDQNIASAVVNNLTLVSHTEFERNLLSQLEALASGIKGTVGFFAIRELIKRDDNIRFEGEIGPFFSKFTKSNGKSVSLTSSSSDQGSEARVANIITRLSRTKVKKHLNHPSLEVLRTKKSDAIILVDDFIGSGNTVKDFLDSFWLEPTILSWFSLNKIEFHVVAYSGTKSGINVVEKHKFKPKVHIYRDAPTFHSLTYSKDKRERIRELCQEYGKIADKRRKNMWLGYNEGMAAIVFEHGCPNNTPLILWQSNIKGAGWKGLFPNRTVPSLTASAFPSKIVREDYARILEDAGQKNLARSGVLTRCGARGQATLIVLGLIAKGQRERDILSFAGGLNVEDCERIIEMCIKWDFITPQRRIAPKGLAELHAAKKNEYKAKNILDKGTDYYYPRQLREATHD